MSAGNGGQERRPQQQEQALLLGKCQEHRSRGDGVGGANERARVWSPLTHVDACREGGLKAGWVAGLI